MSTSPAPRSIWILVDRGDRPAGVVPIARDDLGGSAAVLAAGFDGAMPDAAPHRWLRYDLVNEQQGNLFGGRQ